MKNVLFRCDASKEVGFGHLMRSMALASQFQERECNIAFAINQSSEAKVIIEKEKYAIFEKNNQDYKQWLSSIIEKFKADDLILDVRDDLDKSTLFEIKKLFNIKITTIDDPLDKRLACDFAFYPPIPQVKQMNWDGFFGKLYVGFEWVILRNEFLEYKNIPKNLNTPPKILITAGASDPKGITLMIAKALNALNAPYKAIFILGALFDHERQLSDILKTANYDYEIVKNAKNMAEIMSNCDFAICSFGTTAYELTFLGLPSIFLCMSADHSVSASIFEEQGIAINLGEYYKITLEDIAKAALTLLKNADLRYRMQEKARKLIDGYGTSRIVEVILNAD